MASIPDAPTRVAVVGAGFFGRLHVDAWPRVEGARLVAVCDADLGRAEAAAALAGEARPAVHVDLDAMLAEARPDLVDIATPPETHLAVIERLSARVPWLICQKPFCGGLEGARRAAALVAARGGRLAVHENVRFQPWYREARRLIDAGALGEPWRVAFRLRPGDGRGADAYLARQPYFRTMPRFLIHETAIHWIDTFRFLMGETIGVFARLRNRNSSIAGEDAGVVLFDFAGGRTGLFDGDRLCDHAATDRRRTLGEMTLEGSAATLRLDGEGRLWLRGFGEAAETPHAFDWTDRGFGGDCVFACSAAILADWRAGRDSAMAAPAYLRNQLVEEAIYESAASGRFVALPPP